MKIEGDYARGYVLLADLHRPRLGLRWSTPRRSKKFDPADVVRRVLLDEVGLLAAGEAEEHAPGGPGDAAEDWSAPRLYVESKPPGRDVWCAYSGRSGRIVEVVHHARRRERTLEATVLPTLSDTPAGEPLAWSVFDLSCIVPRDLPLASQALNAGDLTLVFAARSRGLTVRQVAVAGLALRRQPLEKWLADQQRTAAKHYRAVPTTTTTTTTTGTGTGTSAIQFETGGRTLRGIVGRMRRRRRFFWKRGVAPELVTYALHDASRDRLVVVQGTDEDLVRAAAVSVGWAGDREAATTTDDDR